MSGSASRKLVASGNRKISRSPKIGHSRAMYSNGARRLASACAPKDITLADVYLALDERLVASTETDDTPACSVEHALHERVSSVLADVEQSLVQKLRETSISDV